MVQLTIDGHPIEVPEGTTVLQAAQQAGIFIPTLCNHPELTPSGGCRLCIVEIDGYRTPMASCTLPVMQGMDVHTDTESLRTSRTFILTMLFSERNHFCPFCQVSGGDCELQNAAYYQGMTHWDYQPAWLDFPLDASHPDIAIDHNRCILCRRCVRACEELAGNGTLGMAQRGTHTMLTADYGIPLGESTCISCGMCIQVCPTGALIDRHSAYLGKTKDITPVQSICLGCSVGCGIIAYTRSQQLVGIRGDWDSPINHGLTCRFGRFEPMRENRKRILQPLVRMDGVLQPATWEHALDETARILKRAAVQNPSQIAAVASTRLNAESLVKCEQLFREVLSAKIVTSVENGVPTAMVSQIAEQRGRPFESSLDVIRSSDCILLIGVNPAERHGVLGMEVNRCRNHGARLIVIDTRESEFSRSADCYINPSSEGDAVVLQKIIRSVTGAADNRLPVEIMTAANHLRSAERVVILYGKGITSQPVPDALEQLCSLTETLNAADMISVKGEANSLMAGQLHLDTPFTVTRDQTVFVALGDDYATERLTEQLKHAAAVITMASYHSEATALADIVLPAAIWSEQSGHFLNLDGRLQFAQQIQSASGECLPNAEILSAICERLTAAAQQEWRSRIMMRTPPVALKLN